MPPPTSRRWPRSTASGIRHWVRPARLIGDDGRSRAIELEYTRTRRRGRLVGTGELFTLPADMVFKAIGQLLAPAT